MMRLVRTLFNEAEPAFQHPLYRSISSTPHLDSFIDKIKGVISGNKTTPEPPPSDSFTLLQFAEQLRMAKKAGNLKQFVVGRSSEATFTDAFEKQEAVLRYLGGFDPNGEVQKLMGSSPLDLARSNMAKSGQISRNAPCPCGSNKRYKRCCGNN
uniref:Uncharacterized protein n=1 Tax=Kalanchoe fedtschenkoi TaxID=63787 RepID=A0A7N0V040_KALFE